MLIEKSISVKDIDKMVYLNKCVKEAFRLHPPLCGLPKGVDKPLEVGKYSINDKNQVFYFLYHANRDKNIRAGLAFKSEIAKLMREHNDANVLVLPGRFINIQDALKCIKNFLTTDFEGKRHQDRVNKLS